LTRPVINEEGRTLYLSRPEARPAEGGAQVLLPIGRPLKPSDLIRPVPVEEQQSTFLVPNKPGQNLLPNDRPLTPADLINGQEEKDITYLTRPVPVENESSFLAVNKPNQGLLPADRPLTPEDLINNGQQEQEVVFGGSGSSLDGIGKPVLITPEQVKPAVKPIPINQQIGGNYPDSYYPVRPSKPAVRPIPINQQIGGNYPDSYYPVRPAKPIIF
jgi:hypothetical protein